MTETAIAKRFDDDTLASLASMDDAIALLTGAGMEIRDVKDLIGDGFSLSEKSALVNVPFLIFDSKIVTDGDHGDFSVTRVVTSDGRKLVLTDGGTGIFRQIQQMHGRGIFGGVICKEGLTVSEYTYTDEKGKDTPAKTYYFAL